MQGQPAPLVHFFSSSSSTASTTTTTHHPWWTGSRILREEFWISQTFPNTKLRERLTSKYLLPKRTKLKAPVNLKKLLGKYSISYFDHLINTWISVWWAHGLLDCHWSRYSLSSLPATLSRLLAPVSENLALWYSAIKFDSSWVSTSHNLNGMVWFGE